MDTENRIEKAFHEQTQFIIAQQQKFDDRFQKSEARFDRILLAVLTVGIAIVVAVFIRPNL